MVASLRHHLPQSLNHAEEIDSFFGSLTKALETSWGLAFATGDSPATIVEDVAVEHPVVGSDASEQRQQDDEQPGSEQTLLIDPSAKATPASL